MSGPPDYSVNPFFDQPQPAAGGGASPVDQAHALAQQAVARTDRQQWGPHLLTPVEQRTLAGAPKTTGTAVTLEAHRAPFGLGLLFRGFLSGIDADQAAEDAKQHAAGVNLGGSPYELTHNSN